MQFERMFSCFDLKLTQEALGLLYATLVYYCCSPLFSWARRTQTLTVLFLRGWLPGHDLRPVALISVLPGSFGEVSIWSTGLNLLVCYFIYRSL